MMGGPSSAMPPMGWESMKGSAGRGSYEDRFEDRRSFPDLDYGSSAELAQRKRAYLTMQGRAEERSSMPDHIMESRYVHMAPSAAARDMDLRAQDSRNGLDDMGYGGSGGYGRRPTTTMAVDSVRRMEAGGSSSSKLRGGPMAPPPPPGRGGMDMSRGGGGGPLSAAVRNSLDMRGRAAGPAGAAGESRTFAHKSWLDEPSAKLMRKDVEVIEIDNRKEEEDRRRQAKLRALQEEDEWKRKEEATRRKLLELERKEQEIMEKERRLQEDIRRKEEERRMEEQRREEERRLIEIREREQELLRKEEKLKRMEMERRRNEEMLLMEDERARQERLRRDRMGGRGGGGDHGGYHPGMDGRVHQSWVSSGQAGYGGPSSYGPTPHLPMGGGGVSVNRFDMQPPMHHHQFQVGFVDPRSARPGPHFVDGRHRNIAAGRGGGGDVGSQINTSIRSGGVQKRVASQPGRSSSDSRSSAFNRLGPKMPVKARLGGSKSGNGDRAGEKGMSVTIGSGGRQVAKKVDVNSFTVIDEVGAVEKKKTARETEAETKERAEIKERERKLKERLLKQEEERKIKEGGAQQSALHTLDTVVIKRREKPANTKTSANGKTMIIKTPNNLVAKLAAKLKEMPMPGVVPAQKTDKEKTALKKKIKDKYKKEDLPEKILYLALENVAYDESRAILLITKMLKDDTKKGEEEVITLEDNDEDKLDFEADEPDN